VFDLDDTGTRKLLTGGYIPGGAPDRQAVDAASITEHVTYSMNWCRKAPFTFRPRSPLRRRAWA
jgi:hypothetical protein